MEYLIGALFILLLVCILWIIKLLDRITRSRQKGGQLHKKNVVYATIAKVFLKDIPD